MNKSTIQLRDLKIETQINKYAEGSVLISLGDTKVICTASVEDKVPPFLKGTNTGWVSAEYSMLPRATQYRKQRELVRGKVDGRGQEIQRLIGRSLRSAVDLTKIGERTIWIDCDVIQADGGTRTAAISGAFVAMAMACKKLYDEKKIASFPIFHYVSAVSVGIVKGKNILDLCYELDSAADVDCNVVMNENMELIELQGTSEKDTFNRLQLNSLLNLAEVGCKDVIDIQKQVLGEEVVSLIEQKPYPLKEEGNLMTDEEKIRQFLSKYPKNENGKYEFVIATSNVHKLTEIKEILQFSSVEFLSLADIGLAGLEIIEDGNTFEENALIKARVIAERTGKIVIADDSGLSVDILKGQPGIYSARFAGEPCNDSNNNEKLLSLLKNYDKELRIAQFVCAIGVVFPNGVEKTFRGVTSGMIGFEYRGDNGFGYDPLFIVDNTGKTYAEMSAEEKNKISHRFRALKNMYKYYTDFLD